MATGDTFDHLKPRDLVPVSGWIGEDRELRGSGILAGLPVGVPNSVAASNTKVGYVGISHVWKNGVPLPTGLTFKILIADDPDNSGAGKLVNLGVSVAPITSGTTAFSVANLGAESTANVTMSATVGVSTLVTITVANAALGALAADQHFYFRLRRVAGVNDTHPGRILILGVTIEDT